MTKPVFVLNVDWNQCEHGDLMRTLTTVHSSFDKAESVLREHIAIVSGSAAEDLELEFVENDTGDWFGDVYEHGSQELIAFSIIVRTTDGWK